jgi:hypothetical protein
MEIASDKWAGEFCPVSRHSLMRSGALGVSLRELRNDGALVIARVPAARARQYGGSFAQTARNSQLANS